MFLILIQPLPLRADLGNGVNGMTPYEDSNGTVADLAAEDSLPFRMNGKTVANENVKRIYGGSISKFPTVRSCLTDEDAVADRPELSNIEWENIDSTRDADVCLFRIASSYSEIEGFISWLKSQKFRVSPTRFRKSVPPRDAIVFLSASRSTDSHGAPFGPLILKLFPFLDLSHGYSVSAHYSTNSELQDMRTGFSMK